MSREKTQVQKALVDLRKRLKLTQVEFAVALDVGPITVARWETSRSPSGWSLVELVSFARAHNQLEIAEIFQTALYRENPEGNVWLLRGKPEPAAFSAVREIREGRDAPEIRREYLKVLRILERAHARMLAVFDPESNHYRDWQRTHQELKWEIKDEEKLQTKKR